MKKKKGSLFEKAVLVVALFLALCVLSLGLNYWAYFEIQKRLKIQVRGYYLPAVFVPSFTVREAGFIWKDRVQLVKGDLHITFDPLSLLSYHGLRILITSKGSQIKLLGGWALQEGMKEASIDSLHADIVLGRHGLAGINGIDVFSPSFQFSLKNADKQKGDVPKPSGD